MTIYLTHTQRRPGRWINEARAKVQNRSRGLALAEQKKRNEEQKSAISGGRWRRRDINSEERECSIEYSSSRPARSCRCGGVWEFAGRGRERTLLLLYMYAEGRAERWGAMLFRSDNQFLASVIEVCVIECYIYLLVAVYLDFAVIF